MPKKTVGELIVATLAGLLSSALAFLVGVFGGIVYGREFMTGEGASWSGVSVGLPLGLLLAVIVGPYIWLRVLKYGDPPYD